MKKSLLTALVLSVINVFLPVIVYVNNNNRDLSINNEPIGDVKDDTPEEENKAENEFDKTLTFKVKIGDEIVQMSMNEYLPGVLAAEMPASFPLDALKAQAVAARSFILYRLAHPVSDGVHDGVALCSNPAHCKGYTDISDSTAARELYGAAADIYAAKLKKAAEETDGEVMTYENEPILAAFHAISGGRTENASDVWEEDLAYLRSVESPGEETAEKYETVVEYDASEYRERLEKLAGTALGDDAQNYIKDVERSDAGGVIRAKVGENVVKGSEIRMALGLNSADFTMEFRENSVVIRVRGYGHGVGMSQYGARAMAADGADYREILTHYYQGAELAVLDKNSIENVPAL